MWLLCHLRKPQESWFFHPLLPPRGVRIRYPYSTMLLLSLPAPPGDNSQGLSALPVGWDFRRHFAAPWWLPEEKQCPMLHGRSGGASGFGQDLAHWLSFLAPLRPPTVPFSPSTVTSLRHCLPDCWEPPVCPPAPELSPECVRAETQVLPSSALLSSSGSHLPPSLALSD